MSMSIFNISTTTTNGNITHLDVQSFHHLKSQRILIKYGPFNALPSTTDNGIDSYLLPNAAAPCTNCLITFMQTNLEYPDGSCANADTGIWLHHALLYNLNEPNAVCPTTTNQIFATGNERTAADMSYSGTKARLYLPAKASLISPKLMNELPTTRDLTLTINYEYIPMKPSYFRTVVPVWLDITGVCGSSDFPAPANAAAFDFTAPLWKSNVIGGIVFAAGHVHGDGIVLSVLKRNDSLCDSNATYGATPGYVENMSNMNMGMMNSKLEMDMVHISNMSACRDVGRMRRGQNWSVKASYDFTQHALILDMESGYGDCIALMLRRRGGVTVIRITDGCYNERRLVTVTVEMES